MPEYRAPGVYVEEESLRVRSIEGLPTSTAGFVGPTRRGPIGGVPVVITSLTDFERRFGGPGDLSFADSGPFANYVALGVRAFFENGGRRLYVARTYVPESSHGAAVDGRSECIVPGVVALRARHPGRGHDGDLRVAQRLQALTGSESADGAVDGSIVRRVDGGATVEAVYYVKVAGAWRGEDGEPMSVIQPSTVLELVSLELTFEDADHRTVSYDGLGLSADHPRYLGKVLAETRTTPADRLAGPYVAVVEDGVDAFLLRSALVGDAPDGAATATHPLIGGSDGVAPVLDSPVEEAMPYAGALERLADIDEIAIVAAPGHTALEVGTHEAVEAALRDHAERLRYRFAVLETRHGLTTEEARAAKARIDGENAALYYPWVTIVNPSWRPGSDLPREMDVPPSGFIAGIYARTDADRGVWKAPANEVVLGALRFEREIGRRDQEALNPEGVNCLRLIPGHGHRVWGARTTSSDPEWKYVNVRRYFLYLQHSLQDGTAWAVFEPNGEPLWSGVTSAVLSFLHGEWRSGGLVGSTPEEAFSVRCDRSTMTQADIERGRMICEIGVAPMKPAEFVIIRICQKTAAAS